MVVRVVVVVRVWVLIRPWLWCCVLGFGETKGYLLVFLGCCASLVPRLRNGFNHLLGVVSSIV
jgi:hypothetical protein